MSLLVIIFCVVGPRFILARCDHHVVECNINAVKPDERKEAKRSRNFRSIDSESFCEDFNKSFTSLTTKATDDADKITKCYINAVTHTLDRHASSTERTCSNRARQPWYNSEIHSERRVRRKLGKVVQLPTCFSPFSAKVFIYALTLAYTTWLSVHKCP